MRRRTDDGGRYSFSIGGAPRVRAPREQSSGFCQSAASVLKVDHRRGSSAVEYDAITAWDVDTGGQDMFCDLGPGVPGHDASEDISRECVTVKYLCGG